MPEQTDAAAAGPMLTLMRSFGLWGRLPGQFNNPRFLLQLSGNVLVADSGNDRLQLLDSEGKHIRTLLGSQPGHPTGLASDGTHIWVADSANCTVQKIQLSDGKPVLRVGTYGVGKGQFNAPEGLALAKGRLFVADEGNNRIVVLDASSLDWLFSFGESGDAPAQFSNPVGLTVLDDELYVRDTNNHRIQAFSLEGTFLRTFGSEGTGPGQFTMPTGMAAIGNNKLLVAEAGAGRVQVLSKEGVPLQVAQLPAAGRLYGMCVDEAAQRAYVADYGKHQVHVLAFEFGCV
mmetsp:Transcript_41715/g.91592  ORF Transcript_41715/g.91592 Transcript_41715/m.91592 type:complete len:289 (+) Transcript_41715:292-1158(+)